MHRCPTCRCDEVGRRLLACAASGLTAAVVAAAANQRATGAQQGSRWTRTNFAGQNVTLAEGPIAVVALLAGVGVDRLLDPSGRRGLPVAVASAGAALVGAYDDLYGSGQAKGFRGHLRALRSGQLTSGMIKIVGVGRQRRRGRPAGRALSAWLLEAGVPSAGWSARYRLDRSDRQPHQPARPAARSSSQGDHFARLGSVRCRRRASCRCCRGQPANRFGRPIHARRLRGQRAGCCSRDRCRSSVTVAASVACLCCRGGTQPRQRAGELHGRDRAHPATTPA